MPTNEGGQPGSQSRQPGPVIALALSTHPGPTVAVTAVAVTLGVGIGIELGRLALLGIVFLLNQASIGWSNDWIDAERDLAVSRPDKPIARGWVTRTSVRNAAWCAAVLSIVAAVPLGTFAAATNAIFIASAWSYNAWLKSTVLSVVPYIVSFGLLPVIVTLASEHPTIAPAWAIGMGSLLGVAAHFANVLPDLADDDRTGVRGLPHRFCLRAAGSTIFVALAAAGVLAVIGPRAVGIVQWLGATITGLIAVLGIYLVLMRPPTRALFRLIILAALVNVIVLAFSGNSLAG